MADTQTDQSDGSGRGGAETVYLGILEAISRQRLQPGTKLPEEGLAQIFDVSRAQVRSALSRLKIRGLVDLQPNRTAQIAAPSVEEVSGLFDLRRWIEPEVAAEVARELKPAGEKALVEHLAAEQAARDSGDRIEATRLAGVFHVLIGSFSKNKIAQQYIGELVDRSFLAIYLYQRVGEVMCVNEDHEALLAAFRARSPDEARRQMVEHLEHILSRLDLTSADEAVPDLRQAFRDIA